MARCKLDVDNQKFVKSIGGDRADPSLLEGLKKLQEKAAKGLKNGWFNQPMQRFPQYQDRVWKWDFAPEGATSSTRPGWRLYAYLPDPGAKEPIPAEAFWCYAKADKENATPKEIAKKLKQHLAVTIDRHVIEDRFRRVPTETGFASTCYTCFDTIFTADNAEADVMEGTHDCPGPVET